MQLSKAEFFSLTPRLFFKLHAAWLDERREWHRMAALIRVDLINHSICRPQKPLELEDLLPSRGSTAPAAAGKSRSRPLSNKLREEIAGSFRRLFAPFVEG